MREVEVFRLEEEEKFKKELASVHPFPFLRLLRNQLVGNEEEDDTLEKETTKQTKLIEEEYN